MNLTSLFSKVATVVFISSSLIACGGSSDSSVTPDDIKDEVIIKNGGSTAVTPPNGINDGEKIVSNNQRLVLNTNNKFSVDTETLGYDNLEFEYLAEENGYVVVRIELDEAPTNTGWGLYVEVQGESEEISYADSDIKPYSKILSIAFPVKTGVVYEIVAERYEGYGEVEFKFKGTLTIAELNKETYGLAANEILLYGINVATKDTCSKGKASDKWSESFVANFTDKYIRFGSDKISGKVKGSSMNIVFTNIDEDEYEYTEHEVKAILTLNSANAIYNFSGEGSSKEWKDSDKKELLKECYDAWKGNGHIILK